MLRLNDLYPTLQGEGSLAGTPMLLVRLQGCTVGCDWCDTKQSWPATGEEVSVDNLVDRIHRTLAGTGISWVLLTGGEPSEQEESPQLIYRLQQGLGLRVAMETAGTGNAFDWPNKVWPDWCCLSPKQHKADTAYGNIFVSGADEIKFVITSEEDVAWALRLKKLWAGRPHSMQVQWLLSPVWGSKEARQVCLAACLKHGFRFSTQTHKMLGLK